MVDRNSALSVYVGLIWQALVITEAVTMRNGGVLKLLERGDRNSESRDLQGIYYIVNKTS